MNQLAQFRKTITAPPSIKQFQSALSGMIDSERFVRVLVGAVTQNQYLLRCDRDSLIMSSLSAAQLGLLPDPAIGDAYLVPFKGKVTLIIGWQGLIKLALQSGKVSSVKGMVAFNGDQFEYEEGTSSSRIVHKPELSIKKPDWEDVKCAYAVAKMTDDSTVFVVVPPWKLNEIRNQSLGGKKNQRYSPWSTYPFEMAKKTAIRQLCKLLPMTAAAEEQIAKDDHHERGEVYGGSAEEVIDPVGSGDIDDIANSIDQQNGAPSGVAGGQKYTATMGVPDGFESGQNVWVTTRDNGIVMGELEQFEDVPDDTVCIPSEYKEPIPCSTIERIDLADND